MSHATLSAVDAQLRTGFKLEGRTALVTGGSRGIGAAICRSLACCTSTVGRGRSAALLPARVRAGRRPPTPRCGCGSPRCRRGGCPADLCARPLDGRKDGGGRGGRAARVQPGGGGLYAVEARPYSVLMLLLVVSTLLLLNAVRSQGRRARVAAVRRLGRRRALHALLRRLRDRRPGRLGAVGRPARPRNALLAYAGIALAPGALAADHARSAGQPRRHAVLRAADAGLDGAAGGEGAGGQSHVPGRRHPGSGAQAIFFAACALALVAIGRRRGGMQPGASLLPPLSAAVTALGLVLVSLLGENVFQVKYLVATLPAFLLVLGALVAGVPRRVAWIVVLGLLVPLVAGCRSDLRRAVQARPVRGGGELHRPPGRAGRYRDRRVALLDRAATPAVRDSARDLPRPPPLPRSPPTGGRAFARPSRGQIFVARADPAESRRSLSRARAGACVRLDTGPSRAAPLPGWIATRTSGRAAAARRSSVTRGAELVALPSGTRVPLSANVATGFLERLARRGRTVTASGWAVDLTRHRGRVRARLQRPPAARVGHARNSEARRGEQARPRRHDVRLRHADRRRADDALPPRTARLRRRRRPRLGAEAATAARGLAAPRACSPAASAPARRAAAAGAPRARRRGSGAGTRRTSWSACRSSSRRRSPAEESAVVCERSRQKSHRAQAPG